MRRVPFPLLTTPTERSCSFVIAAENVGMRMVCAGHYATEVFGVRAVSKAMKTALKLKTLDLSEDLG